MPGSGKGWTFADGIGRLSSEGFKEQVQLDLRAQQAFKLNRAASQVGWGWIKSSNLTSLSAEERPASKNRSRVCCQR